MKPSTFPDEYNGLFRGFSACYKEFYKQFLPTQNYHHEMPPKKGKKGKKGGKGKKGKKGEAGAGGVSKTEELTKQCEDLKLELEDIEKQRKRESEERNYYQLERDKILNLYEATAQRLEQSQALSKSKDRELEELLERHQVSVKVYQQKIKDLLYVNHQSLAEQTIEHEEALRVAADGHQDAETDVKAEKSKLQQSMREMELGNQELVGNIRQEYDRNMTMLRQQQERQGHELLQKWETRYQDLQDELELRRKAEIHEVEERKNAHINELMRRHAKAFAEIKSYYNDITHNNMDLIKSLKDELAEARKKEAANEKLMFEIAQENRRLSEPLHRALKQVEDQRTQLTSYEKDKNSLRAARARAAAQQTELRQVKWAHEVLTQSFEQLQAERDALYDKFEGAVHEVESRGLFRELVLEKRLQTAHGELERREAQLGEVLRAANLDPAVLGAVHRKLNDLMEDKNRAIREYQFELARVTKLHNDALRTFQARLAEYSIPAEEFSAIRELGEAAT